MGRGVGPFDWEGRLENVTLASVDRCAGRVGEAKDCKTWNAVSFDKGRLGKGAGELLGAKEVTERTDPLTPCRPMPAATAWRSGNGSAGGSRPQTD